MIWPSWPEVAKVLEALAALSWPAVITFAILRFHKDIRALIAGLKLRRGKILGQEFELGQLDTLEKETRALEQSNDVGGMAASADQSPVGVLQQVLRDAGSSPKAALMLLQAEIERQLRLALKNMGVTEPYAPFQRAMDLFASNSEVPKDFGRWLMDFRNVRNQIVHGHDATDDDALRAIDVGLRILPVIDRVAKSGGQDQPGDKR